MKEFDVKAEQLLGSWIRFGASTAAQNERGILFNDLHSGNIGLAPDTGLIHIFDIDFFEPYEFPGDLGVHATALFNLIGTIPDEYAAAFRFGYIHHLGPIGRLIFSHLRRDFDVNSYNDISEYAYSYKGDIEEPQNDVSIKELHQIWLERRTKTGIGDIGNDIPFQEHSKENLDQEGARLRRIDGDLSEYVYEKRLSIGIVNEEMAVVALTLVNISTLYWDRRNAWTAAALTNLALVSLAMTDLANKQSIQIGTLAASHKRAYEKGMPEQQRFQTKYLPPRRNVLLWLWSVDDLKHGEVTTKN